MGSIGANKGAGGGGMGFSMGGGGIQPTSGGTNPTPVNSNNPNVSTQTPNASNTPVISQAVQNLSQMDDASMAALINAAKRAQLPNYLGDVVTTDRYGRTQRVATPLTQRVVVQAGINEKPLVLDQNEYNQFLQDNNIPTFNQLARSVGGNSYTNADGTQVDLKANQITDIIKYSRMNYIGGRHGGNVLGDGTYFDQNGGHVSSYTQNGGSGKYSSTSDTIIGALNPKTARVINNRSLRTQATSWANSHPQTARAIGSYNSDTMSTYALCMGYNVISDGSGYHNVLDRSALVLKK